VLRKYTREVKVNWYQLQSENKESPVPDRKAGLNNPELKQFPKGEFLRRSAPMDFNPEKITA
jgi:hypothetical protein